MRNQLNNLIVITVIAAAVAPAAEVMADVVHNIANGDVPGLRAAIITANTNGQVNTINLAENGTYILTEPYQEPGDPLPTNGLPRITSPKGKLTINGNGATILRADGAPSFRIFEINGGILSLNDLSISGGNVGPEGGGAIFLWGLGLLTLTNCNVDGNVASERGGGIYNQGGTVNATHCTFNNNTVTIQEPGNGGGAIRNDDGGTVELNECTLSGNSGYEGGAFRNGVGCSFDMTDCSLVGNSAFQGGAIVTESGPIVAVSSVITNNVAIEYGAIYAIGDAPVTVIHSTIAGNEPPSPTGDLDPPAQAVNLLPPNVSGNQRLGATVRVGTRSDGSFYIIAGRPGMTAIDNDGNPIFNAGGADVILDPLQNPTWQHLMSQSPSPNANFGDTVIAHDLDGDGNDDGLVASPLAPVDGVASAGKFFLMFGPPEPPPYDWFEHAVTISAPDVSSQNTRFGTSAGIDTIFSWLDGSTGAPPLTTLVVGATGVWNGGSSAGGVYVFEFAEGEFQFTQKLFGPPGGSIRYGASVDIDGDVVVGGAPLYNFDHGSGPINNAGGIVIHERIDGEWEHAATLAPANVGPEDQFGSVVAIRGNTIVAGARLHDPPAGTNAGAAWVFERVDGEWIERQQLLASDGSPSATFGASLHFRDDDTLFIGAPETNFNGISTGGVYEFRRDADGAWVEVQKIVPLDAKVTTGLGSAMDTHGTLLIAGAARDFQVSPLAGSVYVFDLEPGKTPPACPGDLNDSGAVDVQDLLILLSAWGPCGNGVGSCPADLNNSGAVDVQDLLILLSAWGPCP